MITQNYGRFIVVCDCCGEQVGDDHRTWEEACNAKVADPNVKTRRVDGAWQDTCSECGRDL